MWVLTGVVKLEILLRRRGYLTFRDGRQCPNRTPKRTICLVNAIRELKCSKSDILTLMPASVIEGFGHNVRQYQDTFSRQPMDKMAR